MHIIDVLGNNVEITKDDYHSFLMDLKAVSGFDVQFIKIKKATIGRSAQHGHCYLCEINQNHEIVAIKRCNNDPRFVKREKIVADLRQKLDMNHYELRKKNGLKLRTNPSNKNPIPLDNWEKSELVLINFGQEGVRKDLEHLNPLEILTLEDFFRQYGEWTAFNYIIGAKDRFQRNYVYGTNTGILYSIDNEESPFTINKQFLDPNYQIQIYKREIEKFMPKIQNERDSMAIKFREGFREKWSSINSNSSSITGSELDYVYIRQRLANDDPEKVLNLINL